MLTFQPRTGHDLQDIFRNLRSCHLKAAQDSADQFAALPLFSCHYAETTTFPCFKLSVATGSSTLHTRYNMTNSNGLCGLNIVFQAWERKRFYLLNSTETEYHIRPVELNDKSRRVAFINFVEELLHLNATHATADIQHCIRKMIEWVQEHYPRPMSAQKTPTLCSKYWFCSSYFSRLTLVYFFQQRHRHRFLPPLPTRLIVYPSSESAPYNCTAGSRIFQISGNIVHGIGDTYLLPICKRTFLPPRYAINRPVHTQPCRGMKEPMCTNVSTLRSIPPSLYRRPYSTAPYGRGRHRR